jgi:hypothetical protein
VFVFLLLGAAVLALLVWAGRGAGRAGNVLRLGSGLGAGLAAVGAVVSGLRGGWPFSLVLLALSAYLSYRARGAGFGATGLGDPRVMGMSAADARSILGVGERATRPEIEAAYRRLMQMAHPDRGGSAGLAAQLNAARDRLLKS